MLDLTKLEAVNECLAAIGEAPVTSLAGDLPLDAELAEKEVDRCDREVQARGWSFNSDFDVSLEPDGSNEIVLDAAVLRVEAVLRSVDIAIRGGKLYDLVEQSFTFTSPVRVNQVVALSFDDLPQVAREYIAKRAARKFAEKALAGPQPTLRDDEREAKAALLRNDARTRDLRISDTASVGRITHRVSPFDWRHF
jgi:hypothetical protein